MTMSEPRDRDREIEGGTGDLSPTEWVAKVTEILEAVPSAEIFAKYTCPACGERLTDNEPNVFHLTMVHEDCGARFRPTVAGMLLIAGAQP